MTRLRSGIGTNDLSPCPAAEVLMLDYDLESRGELSLYEFVYRSIRCDIEAGTLAPHEKLPSKRTFAQHLGVSLITVENAYAQLVTEGYCYTKPRSGYYVSELSFCNASIRKWDKGTGHLSHCQESPTNNVTNDLSLCPKSAPTSFVLDLSQVTVDPAMVSRVWGRALRRVLSAESDEELYGPQAPKGTLRLRRAIAHRLRETRGFEADPARIVVGAGSQLLDAALAQLLRPRGLVALENPGYPRLAQIYESAGVSVQPIGLDDEGMSMEGLRASNASLVHIMPSHQFPTGIVTSVSRRYELLAWASEVEGRYIVEDDYDASFRMAGRPVASLASIDVAGHVIYTNTFSKSLGPALRMAFMVLPAKLAEAWDERVGFYANTVSVIDQIALARMIETGDYERHVNRYRKAQRDVRDAFIDEMMRYAPLGRVHVEQADSGLHFVLSIENADERRIAATALDRGVHLSPMGDYALAPLSPHDDARFAIQYGGLDGKSAREAARIIASCIG